MIWLDLKSLEERISKNNLTEKDGFNYLLANAVFIFLFLGDTTHKDLSAWLELLKIVLGVGITLWGLKASYKANLELDGKDFLKRFLAISWVVGMRVLLWMIGFFIVPAIIIYFFTEANASKDPSLAIYKDLTTIIFLSSLKLITYLLVINSFKSLKVKSEIE